MRYLFWTGLTVAGFSAGMGTFSLLIGKTSVVPWVVSAISAIATIFTGLLLMFKIRCSSGWSS